MHDVFYFPYTQPIDEAIQDEVLEILYEFENEGYDNWFTPYKTHYQRQLCKALSKGYRLGERVYGTYLNAQNIYHAIVGYMDKYVRKTKDYFGNSYSTVDEYSPKFRFNVTRSTGKVVCEVCDEGTRYRDKT